MGNIEKQISKKVRKDNLQKAILSTIAVVGVVSVAVVAPNALQALGYLNLSGKNKHIRYGNVNRSIKRLVDNKLIEFKKNKNGKKYLAITDKGQNLLQRMELKDFKLKKPKRWDGRWRIIIFDIQEKRRRTREQLRRTLNQIGFVMLQQSVWVYPYDCEDLLMLLKADFSLGKNLLYIVADSIENDISLRKTFSLS